MNELRTPPGIDIGSGVSIVWLYARAGRYELPEILRGFDPQTTAHNTYFDQPEEGGPSEIVGLMVRHAKPAEQIHADYPDDWYHGGAVYFVDGANGNNAVWTIESVDPLTISPSVLCGCGFHGFIRNGKWEGV